MRLDNVQCTGNSQSNTRFATQFSKFTHVGISAIQYNHKSKQPQYHNSNYPRIQETNKTHKCKLTQMHQRNFGLKSPPDKLGRSKAIHTRKAQNIYFPLFWAPRYNWPAIFKTSGKSGGTLDIKLYQNK